MDRAEYLAFAHVCIRQVKTLYLLADLDRVPPSPSRLRRRWHSEWVWYTDTQELGNFGPLSAPGCTRAPYSSLRNSTWWNGPSQSTKGCGRPIGNSQHNSGQQLLTVLTIITQRGQVTMRMLCFWSTLRDRFCWRCEWVAVAGVRSLRKR